MCLFKTLLKLAIPFVLSAPLIARASVLDTVNWAPDTSIDGTGTGVLGGTTTVTYSTAVGFNAGVSYPENWASYLGTAAATGGSVTYQSGGVLGGASPSVGGTTETITFSSTVTNPILLVAFLGGQGTYAADTFNFGPNSYTLLSSFDANVFRRRSFLAPPQTRILRTMGSGFSSKALTDRKSTVFNYSSDPTNGLAFDDGLQSVAFTVGVPLSTIPEPSTLTVWMLLGLVSLVFLSLSPRSASRALRRFARRSKAPSAAKIRAAHSLGRGHEKTMPPKPL